MFLIATSGWFHISTYQAYSKQYGSNSKVLDQNGDEHWDVMIYWMQIPKQNCVNHDFATKKHKMRKNIINWTHFSPHYKFSSHFSFFPHDNLLCQEFVHMTICYVENLSTWKSVMWSNFSTWQIFFHGYNQYMVQTTMNVGEINFAARTNLLMPFYSSLLPSWSKYSLNID